MKLSRKLLIFIVLIFMAISGVLVATQPWKQNEIVKKPDISDKDSTKDPEVEDEDDKEPGSSDEVVNQDDHKSDTSNNDKSKDEVINIGKKPSDKNDDKDSEKPETIKKSVEISVIQNIDAIEVGKQEEVRLNLKPTNAKVNISNSNPSVIKVSLKGEKISILALRKGQSTVTVTGSYSGLTSAKRTFTVNVVDTKPIVKEITIKNIEDINMWAGMSENVTVTTSPTDVVLTATSDDTSVASVSVKNGKLVIEGKKAGSAVITVKATKNGYVSATRKFEVHVEKEVIKAPDTHEILNFNHGWEFSKGSGKNNSESDLAEESVVVIPESEKPWLVDYDTTKENWSNVSLPHTYNDIDTFDNFMESGHHGERSMYTGTAWYRKTFTLPESYEGKTIYLEFEAARQAAEVYINGTKLEGKSENGFIPFGYDLTKYLKYGEENQITVMVDNTFPYYTLDDNGNKHVLSWHDSHWHPTYGGLYRNLTLHVKDELHITLPLYSFIETQGVYVYTQDVSKTSASIFVEAEIKNTSLETKNFGVEVEVLDRNGNIVMTETIDNLKMKSNTKDVFKLSGKINNPELWSDKYPYLYTVVTKIKVDGKEIDRSENTMGIRTFRFTSDYGLFLNENYVKLQGWGQKSTNEWAAVGAAYPNWMQDHVTKLMKDAGANFIRYGHTAGSPTQIQQADKYGMIVLQPGVDGEGETVGGKYSDEAYRVRLDAFRDMIIYLRNSPSILMWELGNQSIPKDSLHVAEEFKEIVEKYDHNGIAPGTDKGSAGSYDKTTTDSQRLTAMRRAKNEMVPFIDVGITTEGVDSPAGLPKLEGEYNREEARRGMWDKYTAGYVEGVGSYAKWESEMFASNQAAQYAKIAAQDHGGGANWIFSDSLSHGRNQKETSRVSGEVDAMMIPKEAYYAISTIFTDEIDMHIIGHWNYDLNTTKDVFVMSDATSVELFINGKSQGKGSKSNQYLFTFKDKKYEPGTLEAIGYNERGEIVTRESITTHKAPSRIKLTPIVGPSGLLADGADVLLVDVEVLDEDGNRAITYDGLVRNEYVHFDINDDNGSSLWRGGFNSSLEDTTNHKYVYIEAGITRIAVKTTNKPGDITITARIDGLTSDTITVTSQPFDFGDGYTDIMPKSFSYDIDKTQDPSFGDGEKPKDKSVIDTRYESKLADNFGYTGSVDSDKAGFNSSFINGRSVYTDGNLTVTNIPSFLLNADYIKLPNRNKDYTALDLVNFTLRNDADVYVAHDDRIPRPLWLVEDFEKTYEVVNIGGFTHSLYKVRVSKGNSIVLGGNADVSKDGLLGNMYTIIVDDYTDTNFLLEDFENQTIGLIPRGLDIKMVENTELEVISITGKDGKPTQALRLYDFNTSDANNLVTISKMFEEQKGKFRVEWDLLNKGYEKQNFIRFIVHEGETKDNSGNKDNFIIESYLMNDRKIMYRQNGSTSNNAVGEAMNLNEWYTISYEVDMITNTFDIYIDDVLVREGAKFYNSADLANNFIIGTGAKTGTEIVVDNIRVTPLENRLESIEVDDVVYRNFDRNGSDIVITLPKGINKDKVLDIKYNLIDKYSSVSIKNKGNLAGSIETIEIKGLNNKVATYNIEYKVFEESLADEILVIDDFESYAIDETTLNGWDIIKKGTVITRIANNKNGANPENKALEIKDDGIGSTTVSHQFDAQNDKVVFEFDVYPTSAAQDNRFFRVLFHKGAPKDSSDKSGFIVESYVHLGKLVYRHAGNTTSDTEIGNLNMNEWNQIRYEIDMTKKEFSASINGNKVKEGLKFLNDHDFGDTIIFESGGDKYKSHLYLDNIKVYKPAK